MSTIEGRYPSSSPNGEAGRSAKSRKSSLPKPGGVPIPCDEQLHCRLPKCFCDAENIPGGLVREETPQMVMITFDDDVNSENIGLYNRLFRFNRTNPNGCPITGTFFVSDAWTDYRLVAELYQQGHEIASHSIRWVRKVSAKPPLGDISEFNRSYICDHMTAHTFFPAIKILPNIPKRNGGTKWSAKQKFWRKRGKVFIGMNCMITRMALAIFS